MDVLYIALGALLWLLAAALALACARLEGRRP